MDTQEKNINFWKSAYFLFVSSRLVSCKNVSFPDIEHPIALIQKLINYLQDHKDKAVVVDTILTKVLYTVIEQRVISPDGTDESGSTWTITDMDIWWKLLLKHKVAKRCLKKMTDLREAIHSTSPDLDKAESDETQPSLYSKQSEIESSALVLLNATVGIILGVDAVGDDMHHDQSFNIGEAVRDTVEKSLRRSSASELQGASVKVFGSAATGLQMQSLNSDVDLMVRPSDPQTVSDLGLLPREEDPYAPIVDAERSLQCISVFADALADLKSVLSRFRNETLNILENLPAPQNVPTPPEDEKEKAVSTDQSGGASTGDLPKQRPPKKKRPTKKNDQSAKRESLEQFLNFIEEGEALLEELSSSGEDARVGQATPEACEAERTRIKSLKDSIEASGESGAEKKQKAFMRILLNQLRRGGFRIKEYVLHARIPVISFHTRINIPRPTKKEKNHKKEHSHKPTSKFIQCDLTMFRPFPITNSAMIRHFIDWDTSDTLKQLLMLLKRFAKSQGIGSAVDGYLSSYAWVLLCLHVLMKDGMIPSLELEESSEHGFRLDFSNVTAAVSIAKVPIPLLLYRILVYYDSEFDVMNSVVTLRGSGEAADKNIWPRYFRWRLSIEDPFERADTPYPRDLGVTVRMQTQQEIFAIIGCARGNLERALFSNGIGDDLRLDIFEKIFNSREGLLEHCKPELIPFVLKKAVTKNKLSPNNQKATLPVAKQEKQPSQPSISNRKKDKQTRQQKGPQGKKGPHVGDSRAHVPEQNPPQQHEEQPQAKKDSSRRKSAKNKKGKGNKPPGPEESVRSYAKKGGAMTAEVPSSVPSKDSHKSMATSGGSDPRIAPVSRQAAAPKNPPNKKKKIDKKPGKKGGNRIDERPVDNPGNSA